MQSFSPHTQGCSLYGIINREQFALFPAHAGVIPMRLPDVLSGATFPRKRGGDPNDAALPETDLTFSPHTRG